MHESPEPSGLALALATQASAWQGVAGAQSESAVHTSSDTTGLHKAQPHKGRGLREMLAPGEPFGAGVVFGEASPSSAATFDGASGPESGALTFDGPPHATPTRAYSVETTAEIAAKRLALLDRVGKGITVRMASP